MFYLRGKNNHELMSKQLQLFFLQEASTIALANMAAFVDRESRETESGSVNSVAADMCGAIGNLLGSASGDAAVNQPNITSLTSARSEEQPNNKNKQTKVSESS